MTSQQLSNFIWNIADDVLRGLFKQHEYGDIILPFVVLRRLDCVLELHKEQVLELYDKYHGQVDDVEHIIKGKTGLSFYNRSLYDLNRLKQDAGNLRLNFNNYINGYSSNVFEIIEHFQLDKPIEKLIKNDRLYELLDKFTEKTVDLHPDVVDNHTMGQVFEELLRKFSEMSNETSGEHYTPRDVVNLISGLVLLPDKEKLNSSGIVRSIFDPCCGTGGMLTIGQAWIKEEINEDVEVLLYGQELNPQTYAICKSDMLISGENPNNIKLGNSLSEDQHQGKRFDYMITNPPFGVSWKSDKAYVQSEAEDPNGRFSAGTPRTSDGSLLFLQHMISKMEPVSGSRIGIVFNGSPLFTGDAGSGESEIRRWIIENDWLECIVALPDQLFFNTGISTYIWILSNNKSKERKGKVQLIDASSMYGEMKKSLGSKRKFITPDDKKWIIDTYLEGKENDHCKIYDNDFFGYTKVCIEQPEKKDGKVVTNKKGDLQSDTSLRDYERIPLTEDIEEYFEREVEPHVPDAWMDRNKDKVGYEINFTRYFYEFRPLRPLEEITNDILKLDKEMEGLLKEIMD